MESANSIWKNILYRKIHDNLRKEILIHFPILCNIKHSHYLALSKYCIDIPERFFSRTTYEEYLDWLIQRRSSDNFTLHEYIKDNMFRLNNAFIFLNEINQANWHDFIDKTDEYELVRYLDQEIHPTYLRLIEGVFFPFIHLIAFFSRKDRGKTTEKLDVYNCVEEIKKTSFSNLASVYRNTVRNGIAHGGITYLKGQILYKDKKGNQEILSNREVIKLVDDLLDICNGLVLALKIFFLSKTWMIYELPEQILVDELKAETETPWWKIEGCLHSEFSGKKQLIIYAHTDTRDYKKVFYFTVYSGVLGEQFAPGYDRYFISIRSPKSWPGWAALDGEKLCQIRSKGPKSYKDYDGVLENNLVFYVTKFKLPKFLAKLETFYSSFKINLPLVIDTFRQQSQCPDIKIRNFRLHRKGFRAFLSGAVVLEEYESSFNKNNIRKYRKRIIKKTLRIARKKVSFFKILRYLPLNYARISLFRKDFRERRLLNFGLNKDLIGTVQVSKNKKIVAPDINGSTIETIGHYRLAWNAAWLQEIEKARTDPVDSLR